MFLHAVSTGLQSDIIRHEAFLIDDGPEEALLEALTLAVGLEGEKQQKLS